MGSKELTYRMQADPLADADPSPVPMFGPLWQVGRMIFWKNLVDLNPTPAGFFPSVGAFLYGHSYVDPIFIYKQLIFRRNLISTLGNVSDPDARALVFGSVGAGILENNTISLARSLPIEQFNSKTKRLNNQTSLGELISVLVPNIGTGTLLNQLEDDLELSLLGSLQ